MKTYLVFKHSKDEVYVYIVEAEDEELAMTLVYCETICIGNFTIPNMFGDGTVAIELKNGMYDIKWLTKPLSFFVDNLEINQNNN